MSLLFAMGKRPDAEAIAACAAAAGKAVPFAISHQPADHPYWVELLVLGLTFDVQGLSPGIPARADAAVHGFAVLPKDLEGLEALTVRPGPHLAAAGPLPPVVRALAALGCELARLPGLQAIGWSASRAAMAPEYYQRSVGAWLDGGVFPGLGLTALVRSPDGAVQTEGLALHIGHELRLEPLAGEPPADTARQALRLIHHLVANGPYPPGPGRGPGGDILNCDYVDRRSVLRIRRDVGATP
ncbi:MAG: hypothetical protein V4579_10995 [Pseudomonadota bacterium]